MKKSISVYNTQSVERVCARTLVVKDGIVRYKKQSFVVFDHRGEPAILEDDPIINPIDRFEDDVVLDKAMEILSKRVMRGPFMDSPDTVKQYFIMRHRGLDVEVFEIAILDNRHKLIKTVRTVIGGPDSARVSPRVLIAEVLKVNGMSCVVSHNHPSFDPTPSNQDLNFTKHLEKLFKDMQIRLLDHIVTGSHTAISLAERGDM